MPHKLLLKDEEILEVIDSDKSDKSILERTPAVAKAQLKKVAKRGSELCRDHKVISGTERWQCRECWQSLLEEIK